jgi:hypothetical protein
MPKKELKKFKKSKREFKKICKRRLDKTFLSKIDFELKIFK